MKKLIFVFTFILYVLPNFILSQTPFMVESLPQRKTSEKIIYGVNSFGEDTAEVVTVQDTLSSYWASSKLVYNFFGDGGGLEDIGVDGKITLNAINISNNFIIPLMANITPPVVPLEIDTVKQNIESLLLSNDGINLGIYPYYKIKFDNIRGGKTSLFAVFTAFGKVKINGLKDSTNEINNIYQSEFGINILTQFGGFVKTKSPGNFSIQLSYSSILSSEQNFLNQYSAYSNNQEKNWLNFNTTLIIPVINDGLGILFNYRIASKTIGQFSTGIIYAQGL